jgi:hypothetical protein
VANGTRIAATVAVVITILPLAACGGNNQTRMRATLTDEGCTYQGDTKPAAGKFTIEVKNQTQHGANFAFARLANGFTPATARPILARETTWIRSLSEAELRDLQQGTAPPHHPRPKLPQVFDFERGGSATDIGAGATAVLPGDISPAGRYAIICRNITRTEGQRHLNAWKHYRQYVAAQIDVTGALPGVTTSTVH